LVGQKTAITPIEDGTVFHSGDTIDGRRG